MKQKLLPQEKEDDACDLETEKQELIDDFCAYMRLTYNELHLASAQQTEALRMPLLSMELKKEVIDQWKRFQKLLETRLVPTALALHSRIETVLAHPALSTTERKIHAEFLRSKDTSFQEKEQYVATLEQQLLHTTQNKEEEKTEKKEHKNKQKEDKQNSTQADTPATEEDEHKIGEEKHLVTSAQRGEERAQKTHTPSLRLQDALCQLPSSLRHFYKQGVTNGQFRKIEKLMKRRTDAHHQGKLSSEQELHEFKRRKTTTTNIIFTDRDTIAHASLDTVNALAERTETEDAVFIPQGIAYQTHATIVTHVHTSIAQAIDEQEKASHNTMVI